MYFRTSGAWGSGSSGNLTPAEVDQNFWQLIQMVNAKATAGVGIAAFNIVGDELWVTLTDHTILGPYILPVVSISFVGPWQPNTQYLVNQIFTNNGSTYIVAINHISADTFDPGANDGMGHDYYGLLLSPADGGLPAGGAAGMALEKTTSADYAVGWVWPTLATLHDVLQSPGPATGQLLYWNGTHFSYINQGSIAAAPSALSDSSDVQQSPGPTAEQVLYWTGSLWSFSTIAALAPFPPQYLAQLADVAPTPTPNPGQVVYWNGGLFSYETLISSLLTDFNLASSPASRDSILYDTATSKWISRQPITYTSQGGGSYTLNLTDSMSAIDLTGGGQTVTIAPDSSVNFATGTTVWLRQYTAGTGNINTIAPGSGVTIIKPAGRLLKTRGIGAVVKLQKIGANSWEASGDLAYDLSTNILPSSTFNADPTLTDCDVYAWTPTGNSTMNIPSAGAVQVGKRMTFVITTSGTSSYTLTFGTHCKSQGTLATGVVSGAVFVIEFVSDGTNFNEVSRTTAM